MRKNILGCRSDCRDTFTQFKHIRYRDTQIQRYTDRYKLQRQNIDYRDTDHKNTVKHQYREIDTEPRR